jgi:PAS domain S-box-containing protein
MPNLSAVSSLKDIHWRRILPTFLKLAFFLTTLLAIFLSIRTWESMRYNFQLLTHEEQSHMELARSLLRQELERMSIDLRTFSGTPVIRHFLANPSKQVARQSLQAGLSNYLKNREDYDQAQIFDNNSRELIRVEKKGGQTVIIPVQELNDKTPNAFVKLALQLQIQDRITISPMELTRDQKGEITRPFHPVFHMATPIFDLHDHKVGILLFTARGQQILDLYTSTIKQHQDPDKHLNGNNPQILNQEGYWLLTLNKEEEWGFTRDSQHRFDHRFPDIWQAMRKQGQGQIKTADGLFTFTTLALVAEKGNAKESGNTHPADFNTEEGQAPAPFWILLNQISPEKLNRLYAHTQRFNLLLFLVLVICTLPLILWVALLLDKRQRDKTLMQAQEQRMAHLKIVLQTIIKIHQLFSQAKERQELVQQCCDILVTNRGYTSAWILLLNQEEKIVISAKSGLLLNFDQFKERVDSGNLPPCILECRARHEIMAIDTPSVFCNECLMVNSFPQVGIMCAELEYESHIFGYLNVLLPIDFIQGQDEKNRFSELAEDLGYALFNLEQQEEKLWMESSLRASEERLRGITDSAQDAILMMDAQGAITYWNPASEKILGYRAEEALGKNLHTLLAPSRYYAAHHAAFPEFVRTGHGEAVGKTVELSALRKDGQEIPVTLSLSAIFQDGGWHAVGVLRDMTDHKLMEERMLQAEKMTTIASLAAGVAHEINTPLSAILQSIQVIQQSLDPKLAKNQDVADQCGLDLAKAQDYFQAREINFFMDGIRESAIKSGKIITNLLQFSRPQKLEFAPEDLALLLDKAVELAKNDYNLKKNYDILNIEIIREYTPDLPPVLCVSMDIEQVFINLLKNAAQAMGDQPEPKPKARITLRTRQLNEMIRVEIADNGPGIEEETRRHIFDPFFTTKDIGVGTGLGLSVSYTIIVTKHGGQLTVLSVPGQGATFAVDLPLNHKKQQQDVS